MATGIESKVITVEDLEYMRRMIGLYSVKRGLHLRRRKGNRNYLATNSDEAVASMERLIALGWVRQGRNEGTLTNYHVTREGCRALGLTEQLIEEVFDEN